MWKRLWLRTERCFLYQVVRLFRIRAASEKVARGFALGLIVNFFPTFGFGVLVSGIVARMFGGNAMAGLVGGSVLTFFWPLLFYFNIKVGGLFYQPDVAVEEVGDVTEKTVGALVWGKTFTVGAIINCIVVGLFVYYSLRLMYAKIRPGMLAYFRHHAKDHQRRFRLPRSASERA
ncbi:MAG TPA: DUF2062 domain-containing protein [Verrucomicrobiota bacterium]|nr:DUF2062 domain-containing protein [Verrucomicrobiota bacterium]